MRSIYIAILYSLDMDHTVLPANYTMTALPFLRKRLPDGASTECGGEHLIAAHYSFIEPERMKD